VHLAPCAREPAVAAARGRLASGRASLQRALHDVTTRDAMRILGSKMIL